MQCTFQGTISIDPDMIVLGWQAEIMCKTPSVIQISSVDYKYSYMLKQVPPARYIDTYTHSKAEVPRYEHDHICPLKKRSCLLRSQLVP